MSTIVVRVYFTFKGGFGGGVDRSQDTLLTLLIAMETFYK